ncbi:MAG TPA: SDR family oxidoreductase [Terriglobales bacterium]|jgi:nucleoside-diphosphate-sugar epimerase|nr:SDR family oxidoreductase [Terriglobales bacterium]
MRIFVTGGTGFVGSAVVRELIDAGYRVLGLARSETGAKSLSKAGAEVQRGSLEDLESLRSGARAADAVIHTAFNHDFSKFVENSELDKRAIETIGAVLEGSDRPLLVTSGLAILSQGRPATEEDNPRPPSPEYPRASEATAEALVKRGVRAATIRLPQVHNTLKQGLVSYLIAIARERGVSAYVGEGQNRWAAVHVLDAAHLYRLALEKLEPGARYHAVAEEGVPVRDIAESIGRGLAVPVVSVSAEAAERHFGWFARFIGLELAASSLQTQQQLGWRPTGPGLIADLGRAEYLSVVQTA